MILNPADRYLPARMQGLAQRVTAVRPCDGRTWPCRLWFSGGELMAWGWAYLPHQVRRSDGSVPEVIGAYLGYQVHPEQAGLVDDVIDWYDRVAAGLERTVMPRMADEFALKRWEAHGFQTDPASLGDTGSWTQLNERDLTDVEQPALPDGFRFRSARETGPEAAVRAHVAAWAPSTYSAEGYQGVRRTATYRSDLHILVEAPDQTMAASTIMWLDEANQTAEFEPVGTHPDYRRLGLGTAMLRHGMHLAREAGATQMTVACWGAPGYPRARGLYYGAGFRPFTRDAPLIKPVV